MIQEGVRVVYTSGRDECYTKPGYYNVFDTILSISISSKWSLIVFSGINCTGHRKICQNNVSLTKFSVRSMYVCEKHIRHNHAIIQNCDLSNFTQQASNIYNNCKNAIVSLSAMTDSNTTSVFSGFFIKTVQMENYVIGYIATVHHGIEKATSIYAIIDLNGTKYVRKAEVVGTEKYGDIAVLSVVGISTEQTCLTWGKSRQSKIGSFVCNIGYPLGIDYTSLSVGIIRDNIFVHGMGGVESLCTDISIYSGCSGSPLIDENAKVIGIVSYGSAGGFNWGMAQYLLEHVVNEIIEKNSDFHNGYIGLSWMELTPEFLVKRQLQNSIPLEGIVVMSADEEIALSKDDIITAVNGVRIGMHENQYSISSVTWFMKPTDTITVEYLPAIKNYSSTHLATITLREFPSVKWASAPFYIQK